MSRLEEMEAFVRTVEAGSITAAADQLKLAKSAVSRRLKEFEARLGVQLLNRTTRRISLTPDGEALYRRGKTLLDDWDNAESVVQSGQGELTGLVRLTAPLSFGVRHVGPALLDFADDNPGINFDVDFSDRQVDLLSEGIDLAIRIGALADSSLVATRLAPISMIAAASPAYLDTTGSVAIPEDLTGCRELRYAYRRESSWVFTPKAGIQHAVEMKPILHSTSGDFLTEAAVCGMGIVIQPSFLLLNEIERGDIVRLLPDYRLPSLGLYAVYPPTRHLSRRVRALVDFLKARFGSSQTWDVDAPTSQH